MSELQRLSDWINYCQEKLDTSDSMSERAIWGDKLDAAEAAWQDEASKHVSPAERDLVPQVLTVRYV